MLTFIQRQQPLPVRTMSHRHGLHRKPVVRPDAAGYLRDPRRAADASCS
ncbi:MAG: hypothetical protein ACLU3I_11570 [Acutalibacteraceae bacterium]